MAELVINDAFLAGRNVGNEQAGFRRNMASSNYNPSLTPANLEDAQKHGAAKKLYLAKERVNPEEKGKDLCACCGLPVKGEEISLTAELDTLYHLGSGFALYFRFIKYTIGMLILVLLSSGIYNLASNSAGDDCTESTASTEALNAAYCIKGYILTYALPNKRTKTDLLTVQAALNLVVVLIIMIFFHYLRYQFRKTEIEADDKTVTPSDYTIVIEGLSSDTTNKQIIDWIQTFATERDSIVIEKIIRPFDVNQYLQLTKKRNEIIMQKMEHENRKEKDNEDEGIIIESQLKTISQKIEDLRVAGAIKKCPVAYVVLRTAAQSDIIRSKFSKTFLQKVFGAVTSQFKSKASFDKINGVKVEVDRAPEPTDINWLNQNLTEKERQSKSLLTNLITFVFIAMSFGIIILVNWGQDKAIDAFGKDSPAVQGLSIVVSIVIVITNTALTITIDILTRFEKHATNTKFLRGLTQKLAVAQFVNTALTSLFAELILADPKDGESGIRAMNFYGKGGLLEGIFWVFITNAFLGPILTIFDPIYIVKKLKQKRVLKQGTHNKLTQQEANNLFEGTSLNMPAKFAAMIKIILMTTLYAPALPIALVFTIAGLFLSYWADKYTLLRRSTLPNPLDDDLSDAMVEFLEWAACTFAVGNIIYMYTLEDANNELSFSTDAFILAWVTLAISFFHMIFPMEELNVKLFPIKDEVTEVETYRQARAGFNSDYDFEDPNSRAEALSVSVEKNKTIPSLAAATPKNATRKQVSDLEAPAAVEKIAVIKEAVLNFKCLDRYANRMEYADDKTTAAKKTKTMEFETHTDPNDEENEKLKAIEGEEALDQAMEQTSVPKVPIKYKDVRARNKITPMP